MSATGVEAANWRGQWLRVLPGLVLGGVFLALLWNTVDMARVAALMARATWPPLVLALLAYALDFVLRAARFRFLLDPAGGRGLTLKATVAPFIASFGISDVLPLRLGDVFRVWWFHRRFGLPAGLVVAAMIVERVLDLVAILVIGGVALWLVDAPLPHEAMMRLRFAAGVVVLLSIGVLAVPALAARTAGSLARRYPHRLIARAAEAARSVAEAVRAIGEVRRMARMLLLSIGLWLLESLVMIGAWLSLGGAADAWLKPLTAFAVATLGTLVPALPGHFGSFEVFGVLVFVALGIPAEPATATILVAHLVLWLPTALFGIGWLLLMRGRLAQRQPTAPSAHAA
ncbi:lysylphosphatidylglycerol synthase transmembrane domain-containing protein [Novosphingobium sp. BL-8H]|uniref:lysylphosphatidylglycerol synthase transmembrane domain-containing protein n=1 Tax=Novosphingobium sp. BL-8H TaxID=3127640 RepID=UPI0037577F59